MKQKYRVVGISFEHMHMGDNLRMAAEHPACEIVGICDNVPARMSDARQAFSLSDDQVFTDWQHCIGAALSETLFCITYCQPRAIMPCGLNAWLPSDYRC
ncbi:MAG: hypothetical protein R3C53_16705 [Pirellulaceae bacterium]